MIDRGRMGRLAQFLHHLKDIHPAPGAKDAINTGYPPGDLLTIALGETASGNEQLTWQLGLHQFVKNTIVLLTCLVDESAGIDDDNPGFRGVIDSPEAVPGKQLCH